MKSNRIISVRSNCNFALNYEDGTLHPETEIILITSKPVYKLSKSKETISKDVEIEEFRFKAGLEGVNILIGELQLVVKNMNSFEQTASSINAVVRSQKEKTV